VDVRLVVEEEEKGEAARGGAGRKRHDEGEGGDGHDMQEQMNWIMNGVIRFCCW
jgi:hypothetical protein